jgi:hypothetical protein
MHQKFKDFIFFETPTTKAVGSYFVTNLEPTALVVGVPTEINIAKKNPIF